MIDTLGGTAAAGMSADLSSLIGTYRTLSDQLASCIEHNDPELIRSLDHRVDDCFNRILGHQASTAEDAKAKLRFLIAHILAQHPDGGTGRVSDAIDETIEIWVR